MRRFAALALMGLSMTASPVAAQKVAIADQPHAVDIRNGQFGWDDAALAQTSGGQVEIIVSVPAQRAYVYRGGRLVGATTISTGKRGKATPLGLFEILQKREFHRSNLYSNAPMPYMQRLTWDGIALHGGDLPGYPASHGCIRMPNAFAKALFGLTEMGVRVLVTDQRQPDDATPPPFLALSADQYDSERFTFVTVGEQRVPSAGQPLYAPSRPVVQPVDESL